jgi:hypothetical protein
MVDVGAASHPWPRQFVIEITRLTKAKCAPPSRPRNGKDVEMSVVHEEAIEAIREFKEFKQAVLDHRNPDPRTIQQAQLAGMYAIAKALQLSLACRDEPQDVEPT